LSFLAFNDRGYQFGNVKSLPDVEVAVTAIGLPIEQ
jgi:hypothetical protein